MITKKWRAVVAAPDVDAIARADTPITATRRRRMRQQEPGRRKADFFRFFFPGFCIALVWCRCKARVAPAYSAEAKPSGYEGWTV